MNLEITAPASELTFTQRFSSTPRGARLARRLAVQQLHDWGVPHGSDASADAELIVAELAANAVTHGRVPGRDFELRLTLDGVGDGVRLTIEVSDAMAARPHSHAHTARPLAENGRGLQLIGALADSWDVRVRPGGIGKTVRAVLSVA